MTAPARGFGDGVIAGLAIAAALALVGVAWASTPLAGMYADLGTARLPALTRWVTARPWLYGEALAGAALAVWTVLGRPSRGLAVGIVVVIVALGALTWIGGQLPLYELAGNIRG